MVKSGRSHLAGEEGTFGPDLEEQMVLYYTDNVCLFPSLLKKLPLVPNMFRIGPKHRAIMYVQQLVSTCYKDETMIYFIFYNKGHITFFMYWLPKIKWKH